MERFRRLAGVCGYVLVLVALPPGSRAAEIPHGAVELIAPERSIEPGRRFEAGLHFQLEKGWHIYWVNPGDAGQPPKVSWRLPPGLAAGTIEWPFPKRLQAFSLVDFGYQDDVLLLVPIEASASLTSGSQAQLSADLRLIICRDVCIPGKTQVTLLLPVKPEKPSPDGATAARFAQAREELPRLPPDSWKFRVLDGKDSFQLVGAVGYPVQRAFFFPLDTNQIENAAPQIERATRLGLALRLAKSDQLLKPITHLRGVLQLGDKAYAIDCRVLRQENSKLLQR
jgi:DsbC/DsbD-like thiol-disulfide interchange protein